MTTEEQAPARGAFSGIASLIIVGLLVFTILLAALSIPAGFYAEFSGKLSSQLGYASYAATYLWIGPLPTVLPFGVPLGGVFAVLSAAYVTMFVYAATQRTRPLDAIRISFRAGVGSLFESPLLLTMISIGFIVFTTSWVTLGTEAAGAPIGNPFSNVDPLFEFTSVTIAPLREEVGFRVLLVGVVALILSMGKPPRQALRALWRPSAAYEGLVVGGATAAIIWAAMIFSSITFGVCHVSCVGGGGGWDWGKLPEAAYGGLVLGYLYVRFGLHVAVLAHWGTDYLVSAFAFFGQAAYGIKWDSATSEFFGQYIIDFDLLFLFGVVSFLLVAYVGLTRWAARRGKDEASDFVLKAPAVGGATEA